MMQPDLMETEPPVDMNEPSVRLLLRQLVNDATDYARAEAAYAKAELGVRGAHVGPALAMFGIATALALGLIVALIVAAIVWIGISIGFFWAMLIVTIVLGLGIVLLVRAGARHFKQAARPWQKP